MQKIHDKMLVADKKNNLLNWGNSAGSTRKRENQPKHKPYPKKRVNSFPLTTCPTIDSTVQLSPSSRQ